MSAFDTTSPSTTPEGTPATPETTPSNYVAKLVEAKGSNWSDPEVIAKGKLEADNMVSALEKQLSELREDLGKQDYAKDLLEKLQSQATNTGNVNDNAGSPTPNTASTSEVDTTPSASDLESLINETLTKREAENTASQNIRDTDSRLTELFGTEAANTVAAKAKELGVDVKRLQSIASESPTAFFALIGDKGFKGETNSSVSSTVNVSGPSHTSERNWAYYTNLRQTDRKTYYSPKVQQQLLADAERLGDKFY